MVRYTIALLAVGVTLAACGGGRQAASTPGGAAAFLTAWRAHLLASWSVDQTDSRTTSSGLHARYSIHEAQRPPDSVDIAGVTINARRGMTLVACATPPTGDHPVCRETPTTTTFEQSVDQQIAAISAQVRGPHAIYGVAHRGDCFHLTLVVPRASVALATATDASYCIDPRTEALDSSTTVRDGAVDDIVTTHEEAPTPADLALPAGATYAN